MSDNISGGLGKNRRGDSILCFAWGETDAPYSFIAKTVEEVRQFIIDQWIGDEQDPYLSDLMKEISDHDWFNDGELEWTFEIGGLRLQDVCQANLNRLTHT